MKEDWFYQFEVQAYNPFNLSSSAVSNGTRIDITAPNVPIVNSSTHPDQNRSYAITTAIFNWTASDILSNNNMSGIDGYSYILDTHPGTAPDDTVKDRYWDTLVPMHTGLYNQTLKVNSTGVTYAIYSQVRSNLTENDSVRVSVALAESVSDTQDLMGVKVYLIKVPQGASISAFSQESNAISNIINTTRDIKYASDTSLATVYTYNFTVNQTVSDTTNDIYLVVSGIPSDSSRHNLSIGGSAGNTDASTQNFVCDSSNNCQNTTSSVEYAVKVERSDSGSSWLTKYDYLGDGIYYFHVKAKDVAGNWGDTAHYKITVAAGGVSVGILYPISGDTETTTTNVLNLSVKVIVSGNASVYVVAKYQSGNNYTSPSYSFSTTHVFDNVTLAVGINELYAVANTSVGAITRSTSNYVNVINEILPITNKTLRVTYSGGCSPSSNLCYGSSGSGSIGMASETPDVLASGSLLANTSLNTIKIFMSKGFSASSLDSDFRQNIFLDKVNPSFGFTDKGVHYVVQDELRYSDVYLAGELHLPAGTYNVYLIHSGITADGKVNLSVVVR